ncbi:VTT domain-containing protein [bacterium]|nr:VTT domain-containing protein [bacterium]
MEKLKHWLKPASIIGVFGALFTLLYLTGCMEYFKWSVWKEIHMDIKEFVSTNMLVSIFLGALFYLAALLTFLPGMLLFDLIMGYMFPQWIAMLIIMSTASIGAVIIMAGCRFGFKKYFMKEDSKLLKKIHDGFSENEFMYLLFLRLMPFFPFAFVSAALSSLKVSYKKVAATTFIGIFPVAFILTGLGHTFGDLMKLDHMPSFSELTSPMVVFAIFGLSLLSVVPILIKKWKKRAGSAD